MFNTLDVQWVKAFAILIRRNHTKYSKCDWWNDGFLDVQGWLCTNWGLRPFWALCCLTRYQPQVKATQIARPPDPQSIHMLSAVCQQNSHWPFEAQVGNWKRKLSFATASWPFEERLPDDCKHFFSKTCSPVISSTLWWRRWSSGQFGALFPHKPAFCPSES